MDRPGVTDVRIKLARTLRHTGDAEGGIRRLEQLLSEQFARRGPHDILVRVLWRALGALRGREYERAVLRRLLAEQISGRGEEDGAMRERLGAVEREIAAAVE